MHNFTLVEMEQSVRQKTMTMVMNTEPALWQQKFNDWTHMHLREDADSVAVSLQSWNILLTEFGGAPEIPVFSYVTETGS